jgi:hypothetical protein
MTNNEEPAAMPLNRVFCNYCPAFCCYRLPGSTLFVTATDINRLARHFQLSDGEVRKQYIEHRNTFKIKEDGSCIFLSDGRLSKRCSVHEKLSGERAASVMKWLTGHGVEKERLTSQGFGPDRPIGDNKTEEGRRNNRRVEFHIE